MFECIFYIIYSHLNVKIEKFTYTSTEYIYFSVKSPSAAAFITFMVFKS